MSTKCVVLGCRKRAKFDKKTTCFKHHYHRETVEVTIPQSIEVVAPKKRRTRKPKIEEPVSV